jgi:hypothetical protein
VTHLDVAMADFDGRHRLPPRPVVRPHSTSAYSTLVSQHTFLPQRPNSPKSNGKRRREVTHLDVAMADFDGRFVQTPDDAAESVVRPHSTSAYSTLVSQHTFLPQRPNSPPAAALRWQEETGSDSP